MSDENVEEQCFGRHQDRSHCEQPFQQLGRVQQRIRTFCLETALERRSPVSGATAQQQDHQLEIGGTKPAPGVRTNHG
jgi:hypothetical protein